MANPGDELKDPTDPTTGRRIYPTAGQRIEFRKTTRETNGESLQLALYMKPKASMRGHVHPRQEESLEVVSGSVRFRVGGREQSDGAGRVLVIPSGTSHDFWNSGHNEAQVLVGFRPALKTETFFRDLFGLAQENKKTRRYKQLPYELLQLAVLLRKYKKEVYPVLRPPFVQIVPLFVQRVLFGLFFGLLAFIGRRLGYKGRPSS